MHLGRAGNSDRWLVSYADFLTLLFAFFVVMFATAQTDKQKARRVSDSVRKAYGSTKPVPTEVQSVPMMMGTPFTTTPSQNPLVANMIAELQNSLESLSEELDAEIRAGKIQVKLEARGLVISLQDNALFARGSDEIQTSIQPSLDRIAGAMRKLNNPVRLEGHTDSTPIKNERFRNNWDLSVARALKTLDYLVETTNLPIGRFAIAGYGDSVPVASNQTEEGRSRNRRVDVVIINQYNVQQ
jgi:chemotaxis protein MotB